MRRSAVDVVRLAAATAGLRVDTVATAPLPSVAHAPFPARRSFGTAVFEDDGSVLVRLSDDASALRVRLTHGALSVDAVPGPCPADAFPLHDACATPVVGRDWFAEQLAAPAGATAPRAAPYGFYARVRRAVRQPDGTVQPFEAIVTPRGRLVVRTAHRVGGAAGYGAALAIADVDDDGWPELLTSPAAAVGDGDRLAVVRVRADGALVAVWHSEPLAGSVMLAGNADLSSDGTRDLMAVEEPAPDADASAKARLWVIR